MAAAKGAARSLPRALRELRIHHCQTSKSSEGVRQFVEKKYVALKKQNPEFPILIRECSGIYPKIYARYDFGKEKSVDVTDMSMEEVSSQITSLASQGAS